MKRIVLQILKSGVGEKKTKRNTPRHITIKLLKTSDEEKKLKTTKAKRHITNRRTKIRMSTKLWKPEASTMIYLKSLKTTKINLEFCIL